MKKISLLILILLFASCSQKTTTPAKLKVSLGSLVGSAALSTYATGGLVVWGSKIGSSGFSFAQTFQAPFPIDMSIELDNGQWNFYAIAWDGASNLIGDTRCDNLNNVSLSGADVDVSFSMNQLKCAGAGFGPSDLVSSDGTGDFTLNNISACNNLVGLTAGSPACGQSSFRKKVSMKVELVNHAPGQGPSSAGIISTCYAGAAAEDPYATLAGVRLPHGYLDNSKPFFYRVHVYDSVDCGATEVALLVDVDMRLIEFPHGFAGTAEVNVADPGLPADSVQMDVLSSPATGSAASNVNTNIHFAYNKMGAGYSPFYKTGVNLLPHTDCWNASSSPVDCVSRFSNKEYIAIVMNSTDSFKIIIEKIYDGIPTIDSCDATPTGLTFANDIVTPTTENGKLVCNFTLASFSAGASDSAAPGNFSFSLVLKSSATVQSFYHLNQNSSIDSPAASQTFKIYWDSSGQFRKINEGRNAVSSMAGYYSSGNSHGDSCIGTDCSFGPFEEDESADDHDYSKAGFIREILRPDGLGGALHKNGFTTCASISGATNNTIVFSSGGDELRIKDSLKGRAEFMENPTGTFDYRLEYYKAGVLNIVIEGDCGSTQPQYYSEVHMDETNDDGRTEEFDYKVYILGQNKDSGGDYGADSEDMEIELVHNMTEDDPTQSRWNQSYKMSKFKYTSISNIFEIWSVQSNKQKSENYGPGLDYLQQYGNSRIYGHGDSDTKMFEFSLLDPYSSKEVTTLGATFTAEYPKDKACHIGSSAATISVPMIESWTIPANPTPSHSDCYTDFTVSTFDPSIFSPSFYQDYGSQRSTVADSTNKSIDDGTELMSTGSACETASASSLELSWGSITSTEITEYGTNSTNNASVSDQFDTLGIYSYAACLNHALNEYGSSYGTATISGAAGDWDSGNSYESLNDSDDNTRNTYLGCLYLDGVTAGLNPSLCTILAATYTPPAMSGFTITNGVGDPVLGSDFNINYVGLDDKMIDDFDL